jgi:hypothetical protein
MNREHGSFDTHEEIISYAQLRTFIGIIGIALPVMVLLGCFILGAGEFSLQVSISHYYYSKMHIVFTGVLCVLGGFLITYRGKDPWESRLSNVAGACSFGIASFPTTFGAFLPPKDGANQYLQILQAVSDGWGNIHFIFAGLLFGCFTVFCLYFFQKADEVYTGEAAVKFKRRKKIYKFCGWTIIISIVLIAVFSFLIPQDTGLFRYSTFIFETTALWAFGSAWLIKGSAIWKSIPVLNKLVSPLR